MKVFVRYATAIIVAVALYALVAWVCSPAVVGAQGMPIRKPTRIVNTPGIQTALTIEMERNNRIRVTAKKRTIVTGADTMDRRSEKKTRRELARAAQHRDARPAHPAGQIRKQSKVGQYEPK